MCSLQERTKSWEYKGCSGQTVRWSLQPFTTGCLTAWMWLWTAVKTLNIMFGFIWSEKWYFKKHKKPVYLLFQPKEQLYKLLRSVCTGVWLTAPVLTEGVGHVANQREVFLEANLPVVVFIQSPLQLLYGRLVVRILRTKRCTEADGTSFHVKIVASH